MATSDITAYGMPPTARRTAVEESTAVRWTLIAIALLFLALFLLVPLAAAPAIAYARPHDLDIERGDSNPSGLPATIKRILAIGPNARVELESTVDARPLEVELSRTRLRAPDLKEGESVVVKAKNVRVFAEEHSKA